MQFRLVPPLPQGIAGDKGVIGPDSITWDIARHKVVILGGISATLLQVAHPLVAAGVAEHSSFQQDPLRRLTGTLQATLFITFGDSKQVADTAERVHRLHRPVHGPLDETRGAWLRGTYYSALRPDLCLWVYATLVEAALDAYEAFVRKLSMAERARHYHESAPFGEAFGVTSHIRPATYGDFRDYYRDMLGWLVVDERAKQIAQAIFAAKLYGMPVSLLGPVLAGGLLPPVIREGYELNWNRGTRAAWKTCRNTIRLADTLAPPQLRYWQHYHAACARVMA